MNKRIIVLASVALLGGCANEIEDFRAGVPSSGAVSINVPQQSQALIGQTASFYLTTYAATSVVNGGVVGVLTILKDIVAQPPTSHSGQTYVWGPGADSPLDPVVWKLSVTDNGDGSYGYVFQGAAKSSTNFVTVLSGTHTPVKNNGVNDPDHGHGTFLLDFNARATLPAPDGNVGTANVTYQHDSDDVQVDVIFTQIQSTGGQLINATYHFTQPAGGDGTFQFSSASNIDLASAALENLDIESRWTQTGAGRCDVEISGGDLGSATATASQCWDSNFNETFYVDSGNFQPQEGSASSCPSDFSTAVYYTGN
jgi:hypothetical protein